jgi:hypothetical protein
MWRRVALVRTDVLELLVTAKVVPGSPIIFTLMMEAMHCYETSVLTRSTRRQILGDCILHSHSHRRENLKSRLLYHVVYVSIVTVNMRISRNFSLQNISYLFQVYSITFKVLKIKLAISRSYSRYFYRKIPNKLPSVISPPSWERNGNKLDQPLRLGW